MRLGILDPTFTKREFTHIFIILVPKSNVNSTLGKNGYLSVPIKVPALVSFISLICQYARLSPAFQIFLIVRPIDVPCDLYALPMGGWILSAEGSGAGFPIVPAGADLTGRFEDA
jgi:hypothetical protein